jgi:hypothetical protein
MPWKVATPDRIVHQIRSLRYLDGMAARTVAELVGVSNWTVLRYAPGRPGKVPVAPLREAFGWSPLTAADVARDLGWWDSSGSADASRVKRTLGINLDSAHGHRSRRTMIDAETARLIAEAIGVSPWSILPDD